MRKLFLAIFAAASLLPAAAPGAQVQARAYCLSLRFQRGSEPFDLYNLSLSTLPSGVNGELTPVSGTYTHGSGMLLGDAFGIDDPIPGTLFVNVPLNADGNDNGFPDFFEAAQPASGVTSGQFNTPVANGTVTATWNRAAGSKDGTCVLELKTNPFQSLGKFTHTFELLEYQGPCSYTPGSNGVSGRFELTQTGNPQRHWVGPFQFTKAAGQVNQLRFQAGALTNEASQELTFLTGDFSRDLITKTNYYGPLDFQDGDPDTTEEDFPFWILSLDDSNDRDHDGVPDFSEDPPAGTVTAPILSLTLGTTNFVLAIHGELGKVHQVLEANALDSTNWQSVASVPLTNNPTTVLLPFGGGPKFWRIRVAGP